MDVDVPQLPAQRSESPSHKLVKPQALVQAFVFWHGPPPLAAISHLLLSQDGTRLVTADREGVLVVWLVVDSTGEWVGHSRAPGHALQPFLVALGGHPPLLHLCECLSEEGPAICCLHSDGTVVVLSLSDGGCVHTHPQLVSHPTVCVALPGLRHVLVAGNAIALPVLNTMTHKVVCLFNSLSSIVSLPPSLPAMSLEDDCCKFFVSLSADRHLQYWDYSPIVTGTGPKKFEHFSTFNVMVPASESGDTMCCDQTANCDIVLVVLPGSCALYLFRTKTPFLTLPAPPDTTFISGRFVHTTHFLLFCSDGTLQVHSLAPAVVESARDQHASMEASEQALHKAAQAVLKIQSLPLPPRPDAEEEADRSFTGILSGFFRGTAKKKPLEPVGGGQRIPAMSAAAVGRPPSEPSRAVSFEPSFRHVSDPELAGSWQDIERFARCDDCTLDLKGIELPTRLQRTLGDPSPLQGFTAGALEGMAQVVVLGGGQLQLWQSEGADLVEVIGSTSVASAWKHSLDADTGRNAGDERNVTVCHFSSLHGCLVQGCASGEVIVSDCSEALPRRWPAHATCVTALAVDESILLTGAADGSVKVWSMDGLKLWRTFHHHTHAVLHLLPTPDPFRERFHLDACSVGEDRAVIFYNLEDGVVERVLDGHAGDIQRLFFLPDPDFVIVSCSAAVVYTWDVALGQLLRASPGAEGEAVLEGCDARNVLYRRRLDTRRGDRPPPPPPPPPSRPLSEPHRPCLVEGSCFGDRPPSQAGTPEVPMALVDVRGLLLHLHDTPKGALPRACSDPTDFPASPIATSSSFADSVECSDDAGGALTGLPSFHLDPQLTAALALLFQPDDHPSIEKLRAIFHLPRPVHFHPSPVLRGTSSSMSAVFSDVTGLGLYSLSPVMTATRSIVMLAVLHALNSFCPALKTICKQCIAYYIVELPRRVGHFRRPAFSWCATWLADPSPDIKFAARCVINACIKSRKAAYLQSLANSLVATVQAGGDEPHLPASVMALAILCAQGSDRTPAETMLFALEALLRLIEAGGTMRISGVALLGEFYQTWQPHVADVPALLRTLFDLTFNSPHDEPISPTATPDPAPVWSDVPTPRPAAPAPLPPHDPELMRTAVTTLVIVAEHHPKHFLDVMDDILGQARVQRQAQAIQCITHTIQKNPQAFHHHLFRVVGLILKVLDPHMPALRDHCLAVITSALRTAISRFGMVVFQQVKQRLAVGDHTGQVIVYNMRTATKWTMWSAHERGVASMQFSPNGEFLATYCNAQACIKVWQYEGATVLGMPSSPKLLKMFQVANNQEASPEEIFRRSGAGLSWVGAEIRLSGYTRAGGPVTFAVGFGG